MLGFDDVAEVEANPFGASEALWFSGGLHAQPTPTTTLRLRGQFAQDERRVADYLRTLYAGASIQQQDTDTWRLHASVDQQVGNRLSLHAAFATEQATATTYDPRFGDDVREVLFYGDIDDPRNATAARYLSLVDDTFVQRFADGVINPGTAGDRFLLPGAPATTYAHATHGQQSLRLAATLGLGDHRIEVGVEGAWQTLRSYRWNNALGLARFFDDSNVERGTESGISAYDQLDYDLANVLTGTRYFGYDYLGLSEADDEDVDAFFAGTDPARAVAPLQPSRLGVYAEDEATFGPLHLRLGLRLDAFNANGVQLFDAFATQPVIRSSALGDGDVLDEAGNLLVRAPGSLPGGIGDDFAVYADNSGTVVGYRDLDGAFYDAEGTRVDDPSVVTIQSGGTAVLDERAAPSRVLTETDVATALSPRIEARLAVARDVEARAFYARYAEAPDPTLRGTAADVLRLSRGGDEAPAVNGLAPLRSETFGLGATVGAVLGDVSLQARATLFHRRYWDLPAVRSVQDAFPTEYTTLSSSEAADVTGLETTLTLTQGAFRGALHYTYQTISDLDANTLFILATRGGLFPDSLGPYGAFQVDDRPHNLQVLGEVVTDPGDVILGQRWLGGLRASVAARVLSGGTYVPLSTSLSSSEDLLARMPLLLNADLWLEKAFQVGRVEASAYLWIENVFNRANVIEVYRTTGEPDDDGFLASPDGEQALNQFATDLEREAFVAHYEAATQTPYNYGRPRQVRLGLQVGF